MRETSKPRALGVTDIRIIYIYIYIYVYINMLTNLSCRRIYDKNNSYIGLTC